MPAFIVIARPISLDGEQGDIATYSTILPGTKATNTDLGRWLAEQVETNKVGSRELALDVTIVRGA